MDLTEVEVVAGPAGVFRTPCPEKSTTLPDLTHQPSYALRYRGVWLVAARQFALDSQVRINLPCL